MLNFLVTLQILVTDRVERMKDDRGATAVEYGLMVALIAAVIAVVAAKFGTKVTGMFNSTCNTMSGTTTTGGC